MSTDDMLATIITSTPSRIQATPKDETISVCHRLHGSRSILTETWVSTGVVSLIPHFLVLFIGTRHSRVRSRYRGSSRRREDAIPIRGVAFRIPLRGPQIFLYPPFVCSKPAELTYAKRFIYETKIPLPVGPPRSYSWSDRVARGSRAYRKGPAGVAQRPWRPPHGTEPEPLSVASQQPPLGTLSGHGMACPSYLRDPP